MPAEPCQHLAALTSLTTAAEYACVDCVLLGDAWVHLRVCQDCGLVGCCDNSKNQHATQHFRVAQHPVIASAEPGEQWLWCYLHEESAEY